MIYAVLKHIYLLIYFKARVEDTTSFSEKTLNVFKSFKILSKIK